MLERGTICVIRAVWVNGSCVEQIMPLPQDRQWTYKEWAGCFSYVG